VLGSSSGPSVRLLSGTNAESYGFQKSFLPRGNLKKMKISGGEGGMSISKVGRISKKEERKEVL